MESIVELPEGIQATFENAVLTVRGPQGELQRRFSADITAKADAKKIILEGKNNALLGTFTSHVRNMIHGAQKGYQLKAKMLYAHFPISLEAKGGEIIIKNFLGEKQPRTARLFPPTKLEVKGQDVTLKGPDKEALGLTFASLQRAARISKKDPRVFQDGFYLIEKG